MWKNLSNISPINTKGKQIIRKFLNLSILNKKFFLILKIKIFNKLVIIETGNRKFIVSNIGTLINKSIGVPKTSTPIPIIDWMVERKIIKIKLIDSINIFYINFVKWLNNKEWKTR